MTKVNKDGKSFQTFPELKNPNVTHNDNKTDNQKKRMFNKQQLNLFNKKKIIFRCKIIYF